MTLPDLSREPTVYLIPECDTPTDVDDVLQELCDEIFCNNWPAGTPIQILGRKTAVSMCSAGGLTTNTIQCSLICATNH